MKKRKREVPIRVHHRKLDEISRYLKSMRNFQVPEIASEAMRAVDVWALGNYEPGLHLLTRWYQTVRQGTNHSLNEDCGKPLNMQDVLESDNKKLHLDLLVQMIVTLKSHCRL